MPDPPSGVDPHGHRILIVDDEDANRELLQLILSGGGFHEIRELGESSRTRSVCEEFRPDLVILDLRMPVMDGFDVLAEMETLPDRRYLPVLMITADSEVDVRQRALSMGVKDFLTKPFDNVEILLRVQNLLETRRLHLELRLQNQTLEDEVARRTLELSDAVAMLRESDAELRVAQEETIERLAMAAEFRDFETARHIKRMSLYSGMLAAWTGLDEGSVELIRIASGLHDVGKIGIPDAILRKPGPLDHEETEVMRTHAEIGHRILSGSKSEVIDTAALIALTHHERPDGTGYPYGIGGSDIPIEGSITAIADVFDALTSDRVYRPAFSIDEAVRIMTDGRGTHFDADLLDLFLQHIGEILNIRAEYEEPLQR